MQPPQPPPRPVRLVAIDLDGTLLNDAKQVSERTAIALRDLPGRGVRVVIASARPPRSVRLIYRLLELDTLSIHYNGALIWDEPGRRAVFHQPLPGELVAEIVEVARDYFDDVCVGCEVMDRWFTDAVDDRYVTETGRLFKPDVVAPLETFVHNDTTKLMLSGDPMMIAKLESLLLTRFGDRVLVLQTDDDLLQIAHPGAGKAAAVRWVADHYGVPMEQVMAIGDAPNDVGMLQQAGVAVAMDNAKSVVKDVADWIAPSNNDHGVHAALVRFGLSDQ
jgi:Cof subfamily protein (haloacid dehalogenase superfamily)